MLHVVQKVQTFEGFYDHSNVRKHVQYAQKDFSCNMLAKHLSLSSCLQCVFWLNVHVVLFLNCLLSTTSK